MRQKYNSYKGEITPAVENVIDRDLHGCQTKREIAYWYYRIFCKSRKSISVSDNRLPWRYASKSDNRHFSEPRTCKHYARNAIAILKSNETPIVHSDRGYHCRWLEWIQIVEDANLSKQNCFMDIIGINLVLKHLSGRQTVICIGIVKSESNQRLEDLVLSIIEGVWA